MELEFVQTNKGEEQVWTKRTRYGTKREVRLKDYDAFTEVEGARIKLGRVYQALATHERKTRGRMYVNSRWSSPRWYYEVEGSNARSYLLTHETRADAGRRLVEAWDRERSDPDG